MNYFNLLHRSLFHFWRLNLGVIAGAAVAAAVLIGALAVGDSVQLSLRRIALERLGKTVYAVQTPERFFRADLANKLATDSDGRIAAVLQLKAVASASGGQRQVNQVVVNGIDDTFFLLARKDPGIVLSNNQAAVNKRLAERLQIETGEEILLRIEKPGLLPRDAPLSTTADSTVAARVTVAAILNDEQFGRFSLQANQIPPFNVFVSLIWLQTQTGMPGKANTLLAGKGEEPPSSRSILNPLLSSRFSLADTGAEILHFDNPDVFELRSDRVFLDPALADAALSVNTGAYGILTYLVNQLSMRDASTPYSMVTALSPNVASGILPLDMKSTEIVINQWLADDLQAKPGDTLSMRYFVMASGRQLVEKSADFTIRSITPIEGLAADSNLMPPFPGLQDTDDCSEWDPGFAIDLDRIRDKDEEYWDQYRGTPKAFITLESGQSLWGNRFGELTAVRFPAAEHSIEQLREKISNRLQPEAFGLVIEPVREMALKAGNEALDFGQLFLGLSFFLIVSALLLMSLLFIFGVEQRGEQIGILLAIGFTPGRVRRLLMLEGILLAATGALVGAILGLIYTRFILLGLSTLWSDAVAAADIRFYAQPSTVVIGYVSSVIVASIAIFFSIRKRAQQPARKLLATGGRSEYSMQDSAAQKLNRGWIAGSVCLAAAAALLIYSGWKEAGQAAGLFFGAGALLLIAAFSFCYELLLRLAQRTEERLSLRSLAIRAGTRRRGRSMAVIALLACGCFLVVAVGANRKDPGVNASDRFSGTGGFELYAETSLPVVYDLNTQEGLEQFGLAMEDLPQTRFVPFRLREGDDASCLNLNRAQQPQILGVNPALLAQRNAFTFVKSLKPGGFEENPWMLLNKDLEPGVIPAIADQETAVWALGKSLGDQLEYRDEQGNSFKVRIVGLISSSILQGSLLISESHFIEQYPSASGYRRFLIDTPSKSIENFRDLLSRALQDKGIILMPTEERLAMFLRVENTYLSIFLILGGLGLILGSLGLGVVVMRNVLERRGELALLRAVGFRRRTLLSMLIREHWLLLLLGTISGIVPALLAVAPSLLQSTAKAPIEQLCLFVLLLLASGIFWIWLAAYVALQETLLSALRNE